MSSELLIKWAIKLNAWLADLLIAVWVSIFARIFIDLDLAFKNFLTSSTISGLQIHEANTMSSYQ